MPVLHPFIRNSVGCMEFGGCFLNKRLNRTNDEVISAETTDALSVGYYRLVLKGIRYRNFALALII